jgi:thiamine kinase-like enzyme
VVDPAEMQRVEAIVRRVLGAAESASAGGAVSGASAGGAVSGASAGGAVSGAQVTLLSGGITNRNYRVDTGRGSYVIRLAGEATELLGIDRAREHACSRAAEAVGIGAPVVAYFPEEHGALVTRLVEGRVLFVDEAKEPAVMRRAIEAIRRFHDSPVVPGYFSPFDVVRSYHALARERSVPFPAEINKALSALDRIERALPAEGAPCPCHNDLLPGNFIDDGARIHIIDWEYAAMGDRFFDLGNYAVNHQMNEAEERALLSIYFGQERSQDLRRLRLMRLASDMREALWGFLQAGISTIDFDFLGYGREHLDRFLAGFEAAGSDLLP